MAVEERDQHTGYLTTGHEWNGIKELNTPVPRVVYFFLVATILFAAVYWLLMPAWPIGSTYTKGLLGTEQRAVVEDALKEAAVARGVWTDQIETKGFSQIQSDPHLMEIVRQRGRTLFGDNCAVCHGRQATGNRGFPNIVASRWLWGGGADEIAETIRVGINTTHPNSRSSQMPAFGRDKILQRGDIENVVAYVRSLSNPGAADAPADKVEAGKTVFAANCVTCHGEDGKGKIDVGAPDLTDKFWTYGGDSQSIYTSISGGRQGTMPTWESRLSPVDRKVLTLYLLDLRGRSS